MDSSKITSRSSILTFVSSLAAIGVHFYLTQQHIITKYTMGESSPLCNINSFFNCGTSIVSSFSEFLGTPLSIFGIVTQLLILFFFTKVFLSDSTEERQKNLTIAFALAVFSLGASLVMGGISVFILGSICPFCTVAYVLSALTLIGLWSFGAPRSLQISAATVKSLSVALVILVAGGWATGQVTLNKYKHKDFDQMTQLRIQTWLSQTEKKIDLVAPQKFGPDNASMKIVEFADFLCSHCKMAFPKLHTFAKAQGDVQILFQNWPLDGCSGSVENPGRRCDLAKLSQCADQQGKGNEAQEYIFAMQEIFAELSDLKPEILVMSQKLSLDNIKITSCMADPKTLSDVKAQVELGKTLGLEGTPTMFINNKLFQGGAHIPTLQEIYKKIQAEKK